MIRPVVYTLLGTFLSFLVACSDNNNSGTASVVSGQTGTEARTPAPVNRETVARLASAVVTDGSVDLLIPFDESSLTESSEGYPNIDARRPNATALGLALAALVRQDYSSQIEGPLGGSVGLQVIQGAQGPQSVSATFAGLRTLDGVLDGSLAARVTSGSVGSGTFAAQVDFQSLQLTRGTEVRTLQGPAALEVTGPAGQAPGGLSMITWTANFTAAVTGPDGTSSVTYRNFVARLAVNDGQGSADTASAVYNGELQFENLTGGLGGTVSVETLQPFQLAGTIEDARGNFTLSSGQAQFTGNGQSTLTVKGDNTVTLSTGAVLAQGEDEEIGWEYLGGTTDVGASRLSAKADTIFFNGTFITVDAKNPQAGALAVQDGKILALGNTADDLRKYKKTSEFRASTKMVDLKGSTVLPGFIESHTHVPNVGMFSNPDVVTVGDYAGETFFNDTAAVQQRLRAALPNVRQLNPAAQPWLLGVLYDQSRSTPAMQSLTRQDLDQVSTTVPIAVLHSSNHIVYVNSLALSLIKWPKAAGSEFAGKPVWPSPQQSPFEVPPPLARYVGVSAGLPTGQLNEEVMLTPVFKLVGLGNPSLATSALDFGKTLKGYADRGVTSAVDILVEPEVLGFDGANYLDVLRKYDKAPFQPVRLSCYFDGEKFTPEELAFFGFTPRKGSEAFRTLGVKFIADGTTQGTTAALLQPYLFQPDPSGSPNVGLLNYPDSAVQGSNLADRCRLFFREGWQLAIHSNGDAAIDQTLAAYRTLLAGEKNPARHRLRIEHFTVHSDLQQHIDQVKQMGIVPGMTIGHVLFWGQPFHDTILGEERAQNIDPMVSLVNAGVPFTLHSDAPITPVDPLSYIQTAVTRQWQPPAGSSPQILGPSQRVSVDQAIRAVTLDAAFQIFFEDRVGSLEVGKLADMAVLEQNPQTVPPLTIANIKVLATYLGGEPANGQKF